MLVKNKILKEWFYPFGKCKNKEYYNIHSNKLNINEHNSFQDFFKFNFKFNKIELLEFLLYQTR